MMNKQSKIPPMLSSDPLKKQPVHGQQQTQNNLMMGNKQANTITHMHYKLINGNYSKDVSQNNTQLGQQISKQQAKDQHQVKKNSKKYKSCVMLNVLLNAKIKRYWKLLQNFCGNKSIKTVIAKLFVNRIVSVLSKSLKKITFAKVKKYYKNQKPLNKHSNNKLQGNLSDISDKQRQGIRKETQRQMDGNSVSSAIQKSKRSCNGLQNQGDIQEWMQKYLGEQNMSIILNLIKSDIRNMKPSDDYSNNVNGKPKITEIINNQQADVNIQKRYQLNTSSTNKNQVSKLYKSDKLAGYQVDHKRSLIKERILNKVQGQKIKQLRQEIEYFNKRQQRYNQKKRQSLQMLAEQLQQKNQVISQLKKTIRNYEFKLKINTDQANVLQDDVIVMRKQIDEFQRIRDKLQADLSSTKSRLDEVTKKLQLSNMKITQLQNRQVQYCRAKSSYQSKCVSLSKCQNSLRNLLKNIWDKSKRISHFLNLIQAEYVKTSLTEQNQYIKQKSDGQLKNWILQSSNQIVKEMKNSSKIQIVLNMIQNIDVYELQLVNHSLFTDEQYDKLYNHQRKWRQLQRLYYQHLTNNIEPILSNSKPQLGERNLDDDKLKYIQDSQSQGQLDVQISGIVGKGIDIKLNKNQNENSILEILDTPNQILQQRSNGQDKASRKSRERKHSDQIKNGNMNRKFTQKLIQVQLQKKRLYQKLSQLKQKILHLRAIILQLFKALEINLDKNKNSQTASILELIFQFFEYSQQERHSIFAKKDKKKIFGFI